MRLLSGPPWRWRWAVAAAALSVPMALTTTKTTKTKKMTMANAMATKTTTMASARRRDDEEEGGDSSTSSTSYAVRSTSSTVLYDIGIIGGGIVGLSVARECAVRGRSVVLLEREDALASGASGSNSGLGHTGYDAPAGSLERQLLLRSIVLHPHIYRSFGLSYDHVRKCGALVVAWTEEQRDRGLAQVLRECRSAGDTDARLISDLAELRELEPALSDRALGAVLLPYEAVVEPFLVPIGYAESARLHGATLRTGAHVAGARFVSGATETCAGDEDDGDSDTEEQKLSPSSGSHWCLDVRRPALASWPCWSSPGELLSVVDNRPTARGGSPFLLGADTQVRARVVINCSGVFADEVEALRGRGTTGGQGDGSGEDGMVRITPRKGQFVVFGKGTAAESPRHIIESVPSQFTKGVLAWSSLHGNVIVGPTAVDQTSRTDRSTDSSTISQLRAAGGQMLPCLKDAAVVGTYAGLRPASQHRDYQIRALPAENWITVAGIRSTGLSAASGIGEYVADLFDSNFGGNGEVEARQVRGVSQSAGNSLPLPAKWSVRPNGAVPSLDVLAADFRRAGDGTVELYGRRHRVTHAISALGWMSP